MNNPTHLRPLPLSAAAIGVVASILFLVIMPSLREIRIINNKIHTHRNSLELLYRQGQNMRSSMEEYEDARPEIPRITSSVLELGNELSFITSLEEIAAQHKLEQIISIDTSQASPLATQPHMPYRRVLLRLDLLGTSEQIVAMLRELEALPAYINILNLSLSTTVRSVPMTLMSSAEGSSPLLSATLTAATYWREKK